MELEAMIYATINCHVSEELFLSGLDALALFLGAPWLRRRHSSGRVQAWAGLCRGASCLAGPGSGNTTSSQARSGPRKGGLCSALIHTIQNIASTSQLCKKTVKLHEKALIMQHSAGYIA